MKFKSYYDIPQVKSLSSGLHSLIFLLYLVWNHIVLRSFTYPKKWRRWFSEGTKKSFSCLCLWQANYFCLVERKSYSAIPGAHHDGLLTILMSLACLIKCANFKQHNLTLELLVLHGFSGGYKKKKKEKNSQKIKEAFRSAIFANCICRLTCAKTKSGRFSHVFVFLFSWFLKRYSFKKYACQKLFEVLQCRF